MLFFVVIARFFLRIVLWLIWLCLMAFGVVMAFTLDAARLAYRRGMFTWPPPEGPQP